MFDQYQGEGPTLVEITSELKKIQSKGFNVSYEERLSLSKFRIIEIDKKVEILKSKDNLCVSAYKEGKCVFFRKPIGLESFKKILNEASISIGLNFKLKANPKSIRLAHNLPLSNIVGIHELINDKKISAIFDPYFDSKSILTLHSWGKLGISYFKSVRCLTTKSLDKIDRINIENFQKEFEIDFEIKKCNKKEHRRFIILEDKEIVILGCSLNDINKNEVVSMETNPSMIQEDILFFNHEWKLSK